MSKTDEFGNREVWRFLVSNMWDKDLVEELKNRHVLHWNYRCYDQLPMELLVFGLHVEEIYLKGNCLTSLPDWLNSLSNLTNIYLEGNGLQQLPPSIGDSHMLDTLDLQDNQLTDIPESFSNLKNLTTLNLRGNRIRYLPKGFGNLKALAVLNLANNSMRVFPECICDLRSLQELILDNNELKELPKRIVQLPNLCYLSVGKNRLEYLPLMFFVNHASITFTDNPRLTYIQYELGCDLSRNSFVATDFDDDDAWRMDITGCSLEIPDRTNDEICIKIEEENAVLKLPRDFKRLHRHDKSVKHQVPSLFELAVRESYETIAQTKNNSQFIGDTVDWVLNIPSIGKLMNGGPTARCSLVDCSNAVFTEAVMWAMRVHVSNGEGPDRALTTVLFFCSAQCSKLFAEQHQKESAMRVNWSEM